MTFNSPLLLTLHHIILVHHSPSQGLSPSVIDNFHQHLLHSPSQGSSPSVIDKYRPNLLKRKDSPLLNEEQYNDVVDAFIFAMVEKGGLKVVCKAGSCMTSQQEIRPTCQSQYPSDVYVNHVLCPMNYYSYSVMIEAEGLLQRLMQNNCGNLCANVRTDTGTTSNPKKGAREISKENPGKIYIAITNCKTRHEYDVKFKSYYMKRKENLDVELDENGRKRHECYFSGRKIIPPMQVEGSRIPPSRLEGSVFSH